MKWSKIFILSFTFLMSFSVFAEYRVYQYFVKSKLSLIQDSNAYVVTSSLDPQGYVSYHGGEEVIAVDLLRTWMCPGYTGNRTPYCDSPYKKLKSKILAKR